MGSLMPFCSSCRRTSSSPVKVAMDGNCLSVNCVFKASSIEDLACLLVLFSVTGLQLDHSILTWLLLFIMPYIGRLELHFNLFFSLSQFTVPLQAMFQWTCCVPPSALLLRVSKHTVAASVFFSEVQVRTEAGSDRECSWQSLDLRRIKSLSTYPCSPQ